MKKQVILSLIIFISTFSYSQNNLQPYKAETMQGVKWGFKDKDGNKVIGAKYDAVEEFKEGYAVVLSNDKVGFIDIKGNIVIPLKYVAGTGFDNGLAFVSLNGKKFAFINKQGKNITPYKYEDKGIFSEGVAGVKINNKWGFINSKGIQITECKYIYAENFVGGIAKVILRGNNSSGLEYSTTAGFIDKNGKEIIPTKYYAYETYNIGNGFAIVCKDNDYPTPNVFALVNKTGKFIIPFSENIQEITPYENNLKVYIDAGRTIGFKYGFYDYSGEIVFPVNFDNITDFKFGENNSFAKVFFPSGSFFYINKDLKCVEYDGHNCPEE